MVQEVKLPYAGGSYAGKGVSDDLAGNLLNIETFLKETGGPAYYEGNPVAEFTDDQLAAQEAQRVAAEKQTALEKLNAYNVAKGATGGYGYDPVLHEKQNYLNPYQDNVINNAVGYAKGAVNTAAGGYGVLGGARNARSGATAAFNASQPYLQKAYDTQFNADAKVDAANVDLQNDSLERNQGYIDDYNSRIAGAVGLQGTGANTLGRVGQQVQDHNQSIINEQIKEHNFNEARPLNALNSRLALSQLAEAARGGNVASKGGGGINFGDIFGSVLTGGLSSFLGGLFKNEGGEIPKPNMRRRY